MKKQFIVEIEVDEKTVADKYPNYIYNYSSPKELIKAIMTDFIYEGGCNTQKVGMKQWGYAKRVIKEIK